MQVTAAPSVQATEDMHLQRFSVVYDYPVCFTRNLFDPKNLTLVDALRRHETDRRHRVLCFLDDGVAKQMPDLVRRIEAYAAHHAAAMELVVPPELVPGGEAIKNDPDILLRYLRRMQRCKIDRHSYVVAIGGGAVLDAIGFAATICHRGVRHIRVPTTVLAQNDSGVGVKNSVNAFGNKNFLGAFAPPFAVLNDSAFVDELPGREKRAGMAEAVKVALIRDDAFFGWLEAKVDALRRFDVDAMDYLIRRCAHLHMRQIAGGGDPFERGSARPLDYGHWSAHKLEIISRHELRHGEAVAIGIALDTRYSVLAGLLPPGQDERVYLLLHRLGFKLWHAALDDRDENGVRTVIRGLAEFQEHLGGDLTVTLLEGIGVGKEVHEIDAGLVEQSILWLAERERVHCD